MVFLCITLVMKMSIEQSLTLWRCLSSFEELLNVHHLVKCQKQNRYIDLMQLLFFAKPTISYIIIMQKKRRIGLLSNAGRNSCYWQQGLCSHIVREAVVGVRGQPSRAANPSPTPPPECIFISDLDWLEIFNGQSGSVKYHHHHFLAKFSMDSHAWWDQFCSDHLAL